MKRNVIVVFLGLLLAVISYYTVYKTVFIRINKDLVEKVLGEGKETLECAEFFAEIKHNQFAVVVDVRSPGELLVSGKIDKAVNINLYDSFIKDKLARLPKDKTILVYCSSGSRSQEAFQIFKVLGFKSVYQLKGGLREWIKEGYPTVIEEG